MAHWLRVFSIVIFITSISIWYLYSLPEIYKSQATFYYNEELITRNATFKPSFDYNSITSVFLSQHLARDFLRSQHFPKDSPFQYKTEEELHILAHTFIQNLSIGRDRKSDIFTIELMSHSAAEAQRLLSSYFIFVQNYLLNLSIDDFESALSYAPQNYNFEQNMRMFNLYSELEFLLLSLKSSKELLFIPAKDATRPIKRTKPQRFKSLLLILFISSISYLLVFGRSATYSEK